MNRLIIIIIILELFSIWNQKISSNSLNKKTSNLILLDRAALDDDENKSNSNQKGEENQVSLSTYFIPFNTLKVIQIEHPVSSWKSVVKSPWHGKGGNDAVLQFHKTRQLSTTNSDRDNIDLSQTRHTNKIIEKVGSNGRNEYYTETSPFDENKEPQRYRHTTCRHKWRTNNIYSKGNKTKGNRIKGIEYKSLEFKISTKERIKRAENSVSNVKLWRRNGDFLENPTDSTSDEIKDNISWNFVVGRNDPSESSETAYGSALWLSNNRKNNFPNMVNDRNGPIRSLKDYSKLIATPFPRFRQHKRYNDLEHILKVLNDGTKTKSDPSKPTIEETEINITLKKTILPRDFDPENKLVKNAEVYVDHTGLISNNPEHTQHAETNFMSPRTKTKPIRTLRNEFTSNKRSKESLLPRITQNRVEHRKFKKHSKKLYHIRTHKLPVNSGTRRKPKPMIPDRLNTLRASLEKKLNIKADLAAQINLETSDRNETNNSNTLWGNDKIGKTIDIVETKLSLETLPFQGNNKPMYSTSTIFSVEENKETKNISEEDIYKFIKTVLSDSLNTTFKYEPQSLPANEYSFSKGSQPTVKATESVIEEQNTEKVLKVLEEVSTEKDSNLTATLVALLEKEADELKSLGNSDSFNNTEPNTIKLQSESSDIDSAVSEIINIMASKLVNVTKQMPEVKLLKSEDDSISNPSTYSVPTSDYKESSTEQLQNATSIVKVIQKVSIQEDAFVMANLIAMLKKEADSLRNRDTIDTNQEAAYASVFNPKKHPLVAIFAFLLGSILLLFLAAIMLIWHGFQNRREKAYSRLKNEAKDEESETIIKHLIERGYPEEEWK